MVGYTVYTGPHTWYLELNQRIRAQLPGVFSIFGGPHPTFFPEMIEREGVDGLCIGEGEYATLDLMNALERKADRATPGVHLPDPAIPNWWFKLNGEIVRNPLRPLLTGEELDALPFSDRELLYAAHEQSRRTKIKPFITGRGCPYDCAFCFNKAYSDLYGGPGAPLPPPQPGQCHPRAEGGDLPATTCALCCSWTTPSSCRTSG